MTTQQSAPKVAQHNLPLSFVTTGQRVTYLRDVKLNAFATMTREDSPELAELVCRSVNSHADLLAALQRTDSGLIQILHDADRALESCQAKRGGTLEKINEIGKRAKFERDQIRAAIAKATS